MRIISGTHKGRRLVAPNNLPVRPTTDYAKEGLFNLITNEFDIEELSILDLFSGTGNIAFEFASRSAKEIVCIDESYHCINYIKKIVAELEFHQITAFKNDVFRYLKKYPKQFDVIFADPPYALKNINRIPELVFQNKLLQQNGRLIVEHDRKWDFSDSPNFVQHRNYGNVNFTIFN